jgi:MFS family permease
LTFLGIVQPWHIIVLAFLLGIANAFDAPARLALAPELVEHADLTNAIALNAMMFNLAAIVGPAAAAIVYALVGPGWCFTINGLSFLAVIAALILMRLPKPLPRLRQISALSELREGIRYVIHNRLVRSLTGLVGITALFGFSFVILLPAWAVDVLGGDVRTNGWLNSARGVGALLGALTIAYLGRFRYRGKLLTAGTFLFPVLLFCFSIVRWLPVSLFFLCGVGAALVFILNLANAMIQTHVTDELRGRVMSIYSLTFFGLLPLGSLAIGQLANNVGEAITLLIASIILFVFAIGVWIFAPRIRRYE